MIVRVAGRLRSNTSSRQVVYAALAGNLLVALTKTCAAIWTGSSAMLSEAVHSAVDTGNEMLLLYGMHRSVRRADPDHPIGYGREIYFWSFILRFWCSRSEPASRSTRASSTFANRKRLGIRSLATSVIDIERKILAAHPEVVTLFIKPQAATTFKDHARRRFGIEPLN